MIKSKDVIKTMKFPMASLQGMKAISGTRYIELSEKAITYHYKAHYEVLVRDETLGLTSTKDIIYDNHECHKKEYIADVGCMYVDNQEIEPFWQINLNDLNIVFSDEIDAKKTYKELYDWWIND